MKIDRFAEEKKILIPQNSKIIFLHTLSFGSIALNEKSM